MENKSICPWWMGYLLLSPIRKFGHNPDVILGPHIKKGMKILDFGSAMGYFSIPMAKMTGPQGYVYCVDIQEKMLEKLNKRAIKNSVSQIVKPLLVGKTYQPTKLTNEIDFVMLFAVVHEVPQKDVLFNDLYLMIKPGGKILFAEPKGHVSIEEFGKSVQLARNAGFRLSVEKPLPKGLSAFLIKD